ncbi:aminotransferase ALD1-like [Hibiscus syriacus]|uniref:Aminotransferase ALD1-like n=1 Tax=Hibiscus syriacus TaxID=106335 RepID=A0A6A3BFA4_HIBSY|nr:aminotransferase ALD1-like [Hibiscus syriacus]
MATAGLGVSFAEAYVLRSLHKQKMKKMEEQEATKSDDKVFDEMKIPASPGCFSFWVSKKNHSAKVSSYNSAQKPL